MNSPKETGRLSRRLSFALVFVVSGFVQVGSLVEAGQRQSTPSSRLRAEQSSSIDIEYTSPNGPIVRVALMTDVTAIDIGCASGLRLRRASEFGVTESVPTNLLRVEARQRSYAPAPLLPTSASAYRVCVSHSLDARIADKLADELKQKFFEPVDVSYDVAGQ